MNSNKELTIVDATIENETVVEPLTKAQIKVKFLEALDKFEKTVSTAYDKFVPVIQMCLDNNIKGAELLKWAMKAGYSESWTRQVLMTMATKEDLGFRKHASADGNGKKAGRPEKDKDKVAMVVEHTLSLVGGDIKEAMALLLKARRTLDGNKATKSTRVDATAANGIFINA